MNAKKNNDNEMNKDNLNGDSTNMNTNSTDKTIQTVEKIDLFQGAVQVPANQVFKSSRYNKNQIFSTNNPKFTNIIYHLHNTEKSMKLSESGYFTFAVHKDATKPQIVNSLEKLFGMSIVSIKTSVKGQQIAHWSHKRKKNIKVCNGFNNRYGSRSKKTSVFKKAFIQFNPEIEINMEKIQHIMQNRDKIMEG